MLRRTLLKAIAPLLALALPGRSRGAGLPEGLRCEVCGAPATGVVRDAIQQENGFLLCLAARMHFVCAAHDRPRKVRLFHGPEITWDNGGPLAEHPEVQAFIRASGD